MSTEPKKPLARFAARWRRPAAWAACTLAAYLHSLLLFNLSFTADTVGWLFPLLLLLPGLLTMGLLRGGFRRWYRWAAIGLLFLTTYADALPVVLIVGETWALHRQWVTEPDPGTLFRWSARAPETFAKDRPGLRARFRKPKTA